MQFSKKAILSITFMPQNSHCVVLLKCVLMKLCCFLPTSRVCSALRRNGWVETGIDLTGLNGGLVGSPPLCPTYKMTARCPHSTNKVQIRNAHIVCGYGWKRKRNFPDPIIRKNLTKQRSMWRKLSHKWQGMMYYGLNILATF